MSVDTVNTSLSVKIEGMFKTDWQQGQTSWNQGQKRSYNIFIGKEVRNLPNI